MPPDSALKGGGCNFTTCFGVFPEGTEHIATHPF